VSQPSPDARAVVRALDALTTQVRRIADGQETPVVEHILSADDTTTTARRIPLPGIPECGPGCFCRRNDAEQQPPAADEDQALRWARRESLLVLLTRLQRGRTLTEDEAETLRHHVETEIREADTARTEAERLGLMVDEYSAGARHLSDLLRTETARANAAIDRETTAEQAAEEQRRRADIAETELRTLREGLRELGGDPTQIQNLWAQLTTTSRLRGQEMATIDRVRATADRWAPRLLPRSEAHRLLADVRTALDGIEQPTTTKEN
jgi:hypothetical protein